MRLAICTAVVLLGLPRPVPGQNRPPIIDVHVHASAADSQGPPPLGLCVPGVGYPALDPRETWRDVFIAFTKKPPCANPVWSPATDHDLMQQTLDIMRRLNVIGVASGPRLEQWLKTGTVRIIPSRGLNVAVRPPPLQELRRDLAAGKFKAIGEVTNQYAGVAPDDAAFEPYLALAEELDVPVGIHIGTGPPGAPFLGTPRYRARLHSPFTLEPALVRHPKLRVYVMHAGWPMIDEMLAMLWTYPQLYVDTGALSFAVPPAEFERYIGRLLGAGYEDRIMFGSDQMVWPGAMERAIEQIDSAAFLSAAQKRKILFENAKRFLRLTEADVATLTAR